MGVSGQQHAPAALYPRERPGTHCTGGWVCPRAGLNGLKISSPPGFDHYMHTYSVCIYHVASNKKIHTETWFRVSRSFMLGSDFLFLLSKVTASFRPAPTLHLLLTNKKYGWFTSAPPYLIPIGHKSNILCLPHEAIGGNGKVFVQNLNDVAHLRRMVSVVKPFALAFGKGPL